MNQLYITILAGGLGKRMKSELPKVLHKVNNEPMLITMIKKVYLLNPFRILIVVGKYFDIIKTCIQEHVTVDINNIIEYCYQRNPLGTGNAILSTTHILKNDSINLILNGDTPLLKVTTLKDILSSYISKKSKLLITGIELQNSFGYGRLIINNNKCYKIIEESECSDIQKKINIVNCGIYLVSTNILDHLVKQIKNNNSKNEYYLTDILLYNDNNDVYILPSNKFEEIININTPEDLEIAQKNNKL